MLKKSTTNSLLAPVLKFHYETFEPKIIGVELVSNKNVFENKIIQQPIPIYSNQRTSR